MNNKENLELPFFSIILKEKNLQNKLLNEIPNAKGGKLLYRSSVDSYDA